MEKFEHETNKNERSSQRTNLERKAKQITKPSIIKKVVSRLREVFINFKDETQNSSTFKATYKKVRCIVKQYEQDLFGKEGNDLK